MQDEEKSRSQLIAELKELRQRLASEDDLRETYRQTRSALQACDERYRRMFELSNDAIYQIDLETGRFVDANPAACRMLGYGKDELLSLTVSAIHPDGTSEFQALVRSVREQGQGWTDKLVCRTKEGDDLPSEISGFLAKDGQRPCLIVLARDTRERRETAERMHREAARADALASSAARLNAQLDLDTVLAAVCEETARALNVPAAVVLFFDPEKGLFYPAYTWGLPASFREEYVPNSRTVYEQHPQHHNPQIVVPNLHALPDLPNRELFARCGVHAIAIASLNREDNLLGALGAYAFDPDRDFSEDDILLLRGLADQAALAIRNAKLYDQSKQVAAMEERQHLARELHDSVSQSLYGMTLYAGAAQDLLTQGDAEGAAAYLCEMGEMAQSALGEIRMLIYQLRPAALEHGLAAALQERLEAVESRAGLNVNLQADETIALEPETEEILYRIAQEALNNVIKHARARNVQVCLTRREGRVVLEISDDGQGFQPDAVMAKGGWGLRGMSERADQARAQLNIRSQPGRGARVIVEVMRGNEL